MGYGMGFHIPLSVLIIGGLVGILVFAVSSAFTVWFQRNQSASELQGQPSSLSASLLKLAISVGSVVAIVFCLNAIQPHILLDQEGLLVGKDLLTVRSRAGFIAEYPLRDPGNTATTEYIEQGQALVIFRRSPDPKELAAASQQRDSLQEQLNLERTRRPPTDPTLQNQLTALERRLDNLTQRQKELSNQQENALREEAKNNPAGNSEYRQLEQQVIMIASEQKQTALNLQHAFNELRSADIEMEMPLQSASEMRAQGLISQREKNNRIVAYDVLQSKLHGLRERARLLEQEKAAMRTGLLEVQRRIREQLANITKELLEVKAAKQQTTAEHEDVSKRLLAASAHENARLSSRSRQLEQQLAEVEAFIASPESPASLTVTAPWPGYVGYRDLSPASLRPDTGPLAVMYKPGHIWVELQAPLSIARDFTSANTSVQLFIHDPSTTPLAFLGHLDRKLPSPDETKVDLHISTNPPALLVRKLALGEEIQARVHIRSKGFAIASLLEQIPASLLTNQFSLPHVGGLVVVIIASLCLVLLARRTLYHRRKTLKESTINNTRNVPLIVSNNGHSGNNSSSYSRSHTNGSKLPDLPREGKFIFDFTDTSVDQYAPKLDLSHQEVSHIIENMAFPLTRRAIEEHKKMTQTTQSLIEHQNRHPVNGTPDYNFQHWLALGRQLNQSIITNAIDLTLLATLHQQLAQQGSGVAPFIASALSKDIHADMLLGYSLELCVKRLSEVQHKGELGQAVCDLARDLCVLQLFFPALITQIIPNLQQGLTMAMRLATAEVEAETEVDALLVMLQEVLASISNNQRDTSLHME
jgi:hypothetical protein